MVFSFLYKKKKKRSTLKSNRVSPFAFRQSDSNTTVNFFDQEAEVENGGDESVAQSSLLSHNSGQFKSSSFECVAKYASKCWATILLQGPENYLFAFGSWEIMEKNNGYISKHFDFLVYRIMEFLISLWFFIYFISNQNYTTKNVKYFHYLGFWNQVLHLSYSMVSAYSVLTEDKFRKRVAATRNDDEYFSTLSMQRPDSELKETHLPLSITNKLVWVLGHVHYSAAGTLIILDVITQVKLSNTDLLIRVATNFGIFTDVFLIAYPIRWILVVYFWIYMSVYLVYSIIFQKYVNNGIPVYPLVDWVKEPLVSIELSAGELVLGVFSLLVFTFLACVRDIVMKYCGTTPDSERKPYASSSSDDENHSNASVGGRKISKAKKQLEEVGPHHVQLLLGQKLLQIEEEPGVVEYIMLRNLRRSQLQHYLDTHPLEDRIQFLSEYEGAQKEKEILGIENDDDDDSENEDEERGTKVNYQTLEEEEIRRNKLKAIRQKFELGAKAFLDLFKSKVTMKESIRSKSELRLSKQENLGTRTSGSAPALVPSTSGSSRFQSLLTIHSKKLKSHTESQAEAGQAQDQVDKLKQVKETPSSTSKMWSKIIKEISSRELVAVSGQNSRASLKPNAAAVGMIKRKKKQNRLIRVKKAKSAAFPPLKKRELTNIRAHPTLLGLSPKSSEPKIRKGLVYREPPPEVQELPPLAQRLKLEDFEPKVNKIHGRTQLMTQTEPEINQIVHKRTKQTKPITPRQLYLPPRNVASFNEISAEAEEDEENGDRLKAHSIHHLESTSKIKKTSTDSKNGTDAEPNVKTQQENETNESSIPTKVSLTELPKLPLLLIPIRLSTASRRNSIKRLGEQKQDKFKSSKEKRDFDV